VVGEALLRLQRAFGYTEEDVELIIRPMAATGKEPVGSMGTDTPLAVLSTHAPTLGHYFHQLFAQVTNPAIDSIREALVMSLETGMGPDGNTFDETPEQCHQLALRGPIVGNAELAKIRATRIGVFDPVTLSMLWPVAGARGWLAGAIDALCKAAVQAIDDGRNLLILSDRGADAEHVAISRTTSIIRSSRAPSRRWAVARPCTSRCRSRIASARSARCSAARSRVATVHAACAPTRSSST
jgi:glutamate synthase (NADPH/NADH) large chain